MVSLVLLFVTTLSVILFASSQEIRQKNMDMLNRYVNQYSMQPAVENPTESPADTKRENQAEPSSQPNDQQPEDRPDYQLSTFYSVAFSSNGSVLSVYDGNKTVYSNDQLVTLACQILDEKHTAGRKDNLSYVVSQKDGYTLVAFMDNTVSEGGLKTMMRTALIVGGVSLVVLFFVAALLAKEIIRPLKENDAQQKQFISDASHELKTPLAVISTNAELLSRELGQNEWLSNIQYENDRMGKLIKQLLDLSSAENKNVSMDALDFSRVVTGEVLVFETIAFEKGKTLQSSIDEGILLTGNKNQLAQVISVLLDNAVNHATGTHIDVTLKQVAHSAVLSIANDGEEIPAQQLAHIFDRFYRVDEARSGEGQHYGLGLSIAKAIVDKHGGSIDISCADGKVHCKVVLPIKPSK
ncbi:sensor histidine kinase [Atopobium minutum]|uniref:sensor histidine kinase n=1 Tax=Atopobium minutum TaxID=1381 RepID=UPI0025E2745C|nr:HAMP domain-containing sensor histidine kinase [Atopobium minutum]